MASDTYIIVVGMDFSDLGNAAFDEALRLSTLYPKSEIHPIHVDSDFRSASEAAAANSNPELDGHTTSILDKLENVCNQRIDSARSAGVDMSHIKRVVTHFRLGAAADQIVQLAVDLDADLILVGTHGRTGIKRLVLGSVAQKITKTARCPVFIVRPKDHMDVGDVPEIEPPCPDCVKVRMESGGSQMWCKRHSEHHIRPHRYAYRAKLDIPRDSTVPT